MIPMGLTLRGALVELAKIYALDAAATLRAWGMK
jgi:hypothetical protein